MDYSPWSHKKLDTTEPLSLPAVQETLVQILGWEDLLEKG